MRKYNYNIEEIKEAVKTSLNFSEVMRKIGIDNRGGNLKTVKNFIIRNEIDFSHFTYEKRINTANRKTDINDYFNNKIFIKSANLKEVILKNKIFEYKCHKCGISEWNGEPLTLQLHHIDGNCKNNNLDNLLLLCPNCHSQTDNFSGKKSKLIQSKKINYCKLCGKKIKSQSTFCTKCEKEEKSKNIFNSLNKEDFIKKLLKFNSFKDFSIFYNIEEKKLLEKCKYFNLPNSYEEIKKLFE